MLTPLTRVARGHGHTNNPIRTKRIRRHGSHQSGIDTTRETNEHRLKSVLGDVVAGTQYERFVDFAGFGQIGNRRATGSGARSSGSGNVKSMMGREPGSRWRQRVS